VEPITLMLVDDNPRFLSAARSFIAEIEDLQLAATLEGGAHAVEKAMELKPEVALVDLAMPDVAGLQLIPKLRSSMPELGIIALTVHDNPQYRQAALQAGADAFITKSKILKELEPTVKDIAAARRAADPISKSDRILVMDDDPGLRNVYQKALRHKGYEVDLATSLGEARSLIEANQYGVFICDIHMGSERGTDLLEEVGPILRAKGTEIIMASAFGQYRFMTEGYGSEYFLEKPVSIHTLVTLIERVLQAPHPETQPAAHSELTASN